jgi:hypothetical protein
MRNDTTREQEGEEWCEALLKMFGGREEDAGENSAHVETESH